MPLPEKYAADSEKIDQTQKDPVCADNSAGQVNDLTEQGIGIILDQKRFEENRQIFGEERALIIEKYEANFEQSKKNWEELWKRWEAIQDRVNKSNEEYNRSIEEFERNEKTWSWPLRTK